MKPVRQLYLGLFLPYCVGLAFLLFPQHINSLRIPNFFSILAACLIGTLIAQFIRSRKDGATLVQLIPAIVILLVCISHGAALFIFEYEPVVSGSPAFVFYLITTLAITALSAVGFFLK